MKDNQVTDLPTDTDAQEDPAADLQARLEKLEHDAQENRRLNEKRLALAELKVEALRANMISSAVGFACALKPLCRMEAAPSAIRTIATTTATKIALPRLIIDPYVSGRNKPKPARSARHEPRPISIT